MTATVISPTFDQAWAVQGNCVGEDPETFWPTDYDDAHPGRAICSTCPAMRACLSYAIDHEKHGLWGGATEKQRDAMRNGLTAGVNQCHLCDSRWVGRDALRHHLATDHAEQTHPYLCECGRRFVTDHGMRSHVGRAHGTDAA